MRQFERIPGLRDFKPHDERKRNHGYDILALKPGHALRIEIKAHLREAKSVFVTQKEWQQSRQRNGLAADDRWELWNVENLATDAGKVRITRYSYPLLFATISGAHLYGFPSPDSDYDLRGAHVLPLDAVVGLEVRDETVQ